MRRATPLDRHEGNGRGDPVAVGFEGDPDDTRRLHLCSVDRKCAESRLRLRVRRLLKVVQHEVDCTTLDCVRSSVR